MEKDIKLKEFDIKRVFGLGSSRKVLIIGRRSTGKTFLTGEILKNLKDIHAGGLGGSGEICALHQRAQISTDITRGTIIAGLEKEQEFYSNLIPNATIHNEYSPNIIENVIENQKKIYKQVKNGELDKEKQQTFVVMDNCLYDTSAWRDKAMRTLYLNGSNYRIMSILTMGHAYGIPPGLRSQLDYIFILKEDVITNRRHIWEHYCGDYIKFDDFSSIMDKMTNVYDALVFHTSRSNNIEDLFFWYKF